MKNKINNIDTNTLKVAMAISAKTKLDKIAKKISKETDLLKIAEYYEKSAEIVRDFYEELKNLEVE